MCRQCPLVSSCAAKKGPKFYDVRYSQKALRIARRRQHERTEQFRQKYRWRAGVEATMSQYNRLTGVKRLRVRGYKAVRFAEVMKATAVNVARAVAAKRARVRAPGANSARATAWTGYFRLSKSNSGAFSVFSLVGPPGNSQYGYMLITWLDLKPDFLRRVNLGNHHIHRLCAFAILLQSGKFCCP